MAAIYDTSFKELVTNHFVSLLPWLLPGIAGAEVVRLSEELPAALLSRILERIIDLGDSGNGGLAPEVTDAQRKLMLDQAATFATLHLSKLQVQGIVRSVVERRHYMLDPIRDFPWLRAGYEQGIEKGVATGIAQSVLAVLTARNIVVDDKLRETILACQDAGRLNQWIKRATTAKTAAEVVGDN